MQTQTYSGVASGSPNNLHRGIILTMSAEPLGLPPQPLKLLLQLRQMTGESRQIVTLTSSLATIMGVTTNTIRNWRDVLIEEGYIHWMTNTRTGQTTIFLTKKAEPLARQRLMEEQERIDALPAPLPWQPPKPVAMPPDGKPWWRFPRKTGVFVGGTKRRAPIKKTKKQLE